MLVIYMLSHIPRIIKHMIVNNKTLENVKKESSMSRVKGKLEIEYRLEEEERKTTIKMKKLLEEFIE